MFVNHLGDAYADVMRYWMDMSRQLLTQEMTIRVVGQTGQQEFPLIQKDDLQGNYDYRATVLPSIAGQDEVRKKQNMDLYQLLINLPFVDPQKLTSRVLVDWGWSLDGISKVEEEAPSMTVGPDGQPMPGGMDPAALMAAAGGTGASSAGLPPIPPPQGIADGVGGPGLRGLMPRSSLRHVVSHLRRTGERYGGGVSAFEQFATPVNLLQNMAHGGVPPTATGVPVVDKSKSSIMPNIAGHNRRIGGKVDTNIPLKQNASVGSSILNRTFAIQPRGK